MSVSRYLRQFVLLGRLVNIEGVKPDIVRLFFDGLRHSIEAGEDSDSGWDSVR